MCPKLKGAGGGVKPLITDSTSLQECFDNEHLTLYTTHYATNLKFKFTLLNSS